MKIKLNYVIPLENLLLFSHLDSNVLTVVLDTDLCDSETDVKACIVDEVLRKYGICITRFDERAVPYWKQVLSAVQSSFLEREWREAFARAKAFDDMHRASCEKMRALVAAEYRKANEKKSVWIASLRNAGKHK